MSTLSRRRASLVNIHFRTASKVKEDFIKHHIVLQFILNPHLHVCVEEKVLWLFLNHVTSLLSEPSYCAKHADSRSEKFYWDK